MIKRRIQELGLVAGFAIVAGCSAGTTDLIPVTLSTVTIGNALSLTLLGDINRFPAAAAVLGVPGAGLLPAFNPLLCTFTVVDGSFTCPTVRIDLIDFDVKYFLYDSSGFAVTSLASPDIATLRSVMDVTGFTTSTVGLVLGTTAIHHHADMTLIGLRNDVRILNGSTRVNDTILTDITIPGSSVVMTSVATNLRFPFDSSQFPAVGVVSSVAVATAHVGNPVILVTDVANSQLTFNGTNTGTFVVTTNGLTRTCLVDLLNILGARCS